jgi:phenylpropionate dioxygenase-like ring-hydroxylating dioxygenase large terminal subunit
MTEMSKVADAVDRTPMILPIEAYVSADYAREENEKLWGRVWQVACREEELKKVGDFVTYDILDESIIVVRNAPDRISAFYNVCLHRGRRLTEGCGNTRQFACRFHGWRWNLDGENSFVLDPEDWGDALNADNLRMRQVKVGTWGGFVWINMDPDCEPLEDYLGPAIKYLAPFELHRMRYSWRQWMVIKCNWKTALEAFNESYHLDATHPQMVEWGSNSWWSRAEGRHSCHGTGAPRGRNMGGGGGMASLTAAEGQDPRVALYERMERVWEEMRATTTATLVEAARRLTEEVPATASPLDVINHWMASAAKLDADRGVFWPKVSAEDFELAGHDWHLFPNTIILPSVNNLLGYRARPNGYDPDSCIFEVYALELFPEGQEPRTEWVHEPDLTKWTKIPTQDFGNMPEVQRGMKSRGFPGPRPSPVQEVPVTHFHKVLSDYMGRGAPRPIR